MNIECRRSIHRESSETKLDTGIPVVPGSPKQLLKEEQLQADNSKTTNNNTESPKSSRTRRNSGNLSLERTRSPIRPKHLKPNSQKQPVKVPANKSSIGVFSWTIICVLIAMLLWLFTQSGSAKQNSRHNCSFDELKNRYPSENAKLWKLLKSGIDDILTEQINKPSVTLFVHNGGKRAKELIRDIAKTSSNCLDSSKEPVEFGSADFKSENAVNDYGVIIDKYKKTASDGNVVTIANLNEIPAQAARALHSICDRESPIFRKVVILLSLTAENNGERDIDIALNALHALWDDKIKDNELGPLLARVTDEVILLKSK